MGEDANTCVMVLDQIRQTGMGDTGQYGAVQANRHAKLHGVQVLRSHRQNSWDNNGMPLAANGRVILDMRELPK